MRRRPAIVIAAPAIVAIVLIAVGAWWLVHGAPRDDGSREVAHAPPPAPPRGTVPAVDAPPARAPEPAPPSPAVAAAEQLARELGLELGTAPADGPVLMAVEEGSGRPIAGVLMVVNEYRRRGNNIGPSPPPRPPHRLDFLADQGSATRQSAYVTADDGRVRVPRLVANSLVVAYHPSFHGSLWLRDDHVAELRVEMEPSKFLRVRVVDGAGHPRAKIPIAVTEPTAEREWIATGFLTNDDGFVELHPLEFLPARRGKFDVVRVALSLPLLDGGGGGERFVDPRHVPDEPIEFTLPPTGSLAIRVVDGAGALLRDATGSYEAGTEEAGDARDPRRQITMTRRASGMLPMTNGECVLASVGLGLTFNIDAYSVGHYGGNRIVDGPRTDGERVAVDVPLASEWPILLGRLVDRAGAPCAKARATAQFLKADAGRFSSDDDYLSPCITDAEGRFRVNRADSKSPHPLFRITVFDDQGCWSGRADRSIDPAPAGGLDLGDVVVEPLGVLAAGIVVDGASLPVEDAALTVSARPRGNGRVPEVWRDVYGLGGVSGADGRFEIHGPIGDDEIELLVSSTFMRDSDAIPITPGQRDVRIVLQRKRLLEIATRLDDGVPPSAIVVQTRPDARAPWRGDGSLWRDGTLSFEPGDGASIDLRFLGRGLALEPVELAVVADVLLADQATTRDPRLDPVDLRGRLRVTKLLLRDGDGRPVAGAHASLWSEPCDAAKDAAFDAAEVHTKDDRPGPSRYRGSPASIEGSVDGTLTLVAARAGLSVEITAPGFLPQRLETTAGEREIVLSRSAHVRLEVEEAYYVCNLPYHLRAALIPDHADAAAVATPTQALQSGYALDAPVARPGRYRVRITVARLLDDGRLLERDLTPTPAIIDVGDPPTRLPIEVHVDAETLRRLDPEYRSSK